MADRFPLIINPTTKRIEELAANDNLDLTNNSIVGASTITATSFVGNLTGVADFALGLGDAAEIQGGILNPDRLEGFYNIGVATANNLSNAANIQTGTINPQRLNGDYDINIKGNAGTATTLTDAANILTGYIDASRLTGTYDINITGTAFETIGAANSIQVNLIDDDTYYYLPFVEGYDSDFTPKVDSLFVYNPSQNRLGIGTNLPNYNIEVIGTAYFDCNDGNTFTSVGIGTSTVDISTPLLSVYAPNIAINTPGGYFQTDVDTFILNSDVISLNSPFPQTFTLPSISVASTTSSAIFTLGQNIDGSGEDHLGFIYDNVGGTAGVGGTARIFTSNGDLKIVTDYNGTSTGSNITIGSEDIIFTDKTETQEYVRITSSGVGIGTTNPLTTLDVLGTVNFDCNDGNTFTSVGIGTSIVDISTPLLSVYAPNIAINTPGGYFQTDVDTFILNSDVISLNSPFPQTFTLPTISIASSASGLPATFTLGQNIDGSGEDHLGLIYDNFGGIPGTGGVARIFTSNGDLRIVTDYNGISTGSNITIGSEDIIFTDKTETQEYVRITSSGVGIGTTNIIGQLQISTGPAIIGAATSTGTSSQTLQVTGGAYVSDNLGIGITNPTSKIQVQGDINVSGVITSSTRLSTGQTGVAINITQDTISGPTQITIDPSAVGDDTGSVRIKGDLFVDGTQTVINSTSIELADFNVGIATTVGSNELLDGAGIGIGSTGIRKTLTWDSNTSALKSSENFNLAAGKVYEIDGTTLLSSTQLTVDNVNSSGVTTTGFITATNAYVGVLTASTINGDGTNIVGIVTQIISGIGIDLVSTQSQGKGSVTVTSYKPIGKTIYVSQNGNDSNTGLAENYPKRTVKNAAGIASSGDTIKVFPGVYVENNPIVLQKTVSVEGTELRNCIITPQNPGLDLFHVNNGCHITDLSFVGSDSTNGAAVIAFQPLAGVSSNRFFDAARMIRMNLDYIAAEATGYISSTAYQSPVVAINTANYRNYIRSTCLAICHDITRGGNSKCVGVGLSFYTEGVINAGIGTTTIDALKYAVGIAQSCINNVSWIGGFQNEFTQIKDVSTQADPATGSNIDINSCSNVISALNSCVGVVTTIIGVGTTAVGTLFNRTYPGNSGIGTTNPNDPSYSPGVGPITQGPYVRNCTNFISNSIGMKVDGFAAEPGDQLDIGVTGSMSVDSYTQYNQGGIGVSITNGAYSQLVSIFTICDDIAIFTGSGGQCDITNSNSSFGRLGLVADGVGDSTTKSIYRYTGVATTDNPRGTNTITVSGVGSIRPYDGQVCYFGQLYYFVDTINLTNGGSGYTAPPKVNISAPEGPNGIAAQASTTIDAFGRVTSVNIVNSGTQYSNPPTITIDPPIGVGVSATASVAKMQPIYYKVDSSTLPSSGISTVSLLQNLNNTVSAGTTVYFSRVSLQITSSHSFEWVGSGNDINRAKPALGGVVIPENEVVQDNGGIVVYTSTDQAGNFKIGDGVVINQSTGQISGRDFTKALFTTMTPFILALSD